MVTRPITNDTSPNRTTAAKALSAMLAFNWCPTQAFQPTFLAPTAGMVHRGPSFSSIVAPAPVTMDCNSWSMERFGALPVTDAGGLRRHRRRRTQRQNMRPAGMILGRDGPFQAHITQARRPLEIRNPRVVRDTDDDYTLAFDLPPGVDHDGLQVSVSDRLLTVKAWVTHEEGSGPSASRDGWVTRSSRTDSVSRSFVLPEGILASTAAASLVADGKAEVTFHKRKDGEDVGGEGAVSSSTAAATPSVASSTAPVQTTANPPATVDDEPSTSGGDATAAASAPTPPTPAGATAAPAAAERPPTRPQSTFDALDRELREIAKAMWGEELVESLRVPTQEELAERAAAAKMARAKRDAELAEMAKARMEARAKRMMAMRRETMAADISSSEDGSSYLVKVALPEGMTRDRVKLTANTDNSLRVTVSVGTTVAGGSTDPAAGGDVSVYKDVRLPKDALLSDISAKFEPEQKQMKGEGQENSAGKEAQGGVEATAAAAAVSGLEVTVGRAVPPQPKRIDIV